MGKVSDLKINTTEVTTRWLHQASKIIGDPELDKFTKLFIIKAFTGGSNPPSKIIKLAVAEKNIDYLEYYFKRENNCCAYSPFINKLLLGKRVNLQPINNKNIKDVPFTFKLVDGNKVLVIGDVKIKKWIKRNLSICGETPVITSSVVGIGIKNNSPVYYKLNNKLELVNFATDTKETKSTAACNVIESVNYQGRMSSAKPVWREGEPEVSGLYIAGSGMDRRDFLFRGRTPDKNTCVSGKQSTRVEDNLYYFDVDAEEGKRKWQSVSGFYDNGVTHYLDFEVEYV